MFSKLFYYIMLDKSYKALADPTRRRILELLRDRDLPAGDIAAEFPVAWASVSHHLSVLREAELIRSERDGQFIRYSINPATVQGLLEHLKTVTGSRRRRRAS